MEKALLLLMDHPNPNYLKAWMGSLFTSVQYGYLQSKSMWKHSHKQDVECKTEKVLQLVAQIIRTQPWATGLV